MFNTINRKGERGFTLIELLVVIAIIGILASVVLASLNTARDKGRSGAIKSSMQSIRVQAELYYDSNGLQYHNAASDACNVGMWNDPTISAALTELASVSGGVTTCRIAGTPAGQAWALSVPLVGEPAAADNWCTDNTGQAKALAAELGAGVVVCP